MAGGCPGVPQLALGRSEVGEYSYSPELLWSQPKAYHRGGIKEGLVGSSLGVFIEETCVCT